MLLKEKEHSRNLQKSQDEMERELLDKNSSIKQIVSVFKEYVDSVKKEEREYTWHKICEERKFLEGKIKRLDNRLDEKMDNIYKLNW